MMRFKEYIFSEGTVKTYDDFGEWASAVKSMGATHIVHAANSNHRLRIAVSDVTLPSKKKFGEWDEKHKEGSVLGFRTKLLNDEILPSTAIKLTEDQDDISDQIPYGKNVEIRKLIKKGAMDSEHNWINALDLVHQAYGVAEVERPTPSMRDAWDQYEDNILFSVQMLQKATDKGVRDNTWKSTSLINI
jgi:hypothetical protein